MPQSDWRTEKVHPLTNSFEKLIAEGKVTDHTVVFNNMVTTLAELNVNWEVPMKDSWHAKVFAWQGHPNYTSG